MRKVLFKKWVPREMVPAEGKGYNTVKPGTNCYEPEFNHSGFFHEWGNESFENDTTTVIDTFAIVELPDGTIDKVEPHALKFVEPYQEISIDYGFMSPSVEIIIEKDEDGNIKISEHE